MKAASKSGLYICACSVHADYLDCSVDNTVQCSTFIVHICIHQDLLLIHVCCISSDLPWVHLFLLCSVSMCLKKWGVFVISICRTIIVQVRDNIVILVSMFSFL